MTAAEARPEDSKAGERVGRMRTPASAPAPGLSRRLMDVETLATILGVGVRQVRWLVVERRIPYVKVGHYVRFDPEDIDRWIAERRVEMFDPAPVRHSRRR